MLVNYDDMRKDTKRKVFLPFIFLICSLLFTLNAWGQQTVTITYNTPAAVGTPHSVTIPANAINAQGTAIGGGGGGGGATARGLINASGCSLSSAAAAAAGGGGKGCTVTDNLTVGTSYTITVGAGGAGGSVTMNAGGCNSAPSNIISTNGAGGSPSTITGSTTITASGGGGAPSVFNYTTTNTPCAKYDVGGTSCVTADNGGDGVITNGTTCNAVLPSASCACPTVPRDNQASNIFKGGNGGGSNNGAIITNSNNTPAVSGGAGTSPGGGGGGGAARSGSHQEVNRGNGGNGANGRVTIKLDLPKPTFTISSSSNMTFTITNYESSSDITYYLYDDDTQIDVFLSNTLTMSPTSGNYTVRAEYNNIQSGGLLTISSGDSITYNGGIVTVSSGVKFISINPTSAIPNQDTTICSGAFTFVPPSGVIPNGSSYYWTVSNNPDMGQSYSNEDDIFTIEQTLINHTDTNQTITYSVTLSSGEEFELEVTVRPTPRVEILNGNILNSNDYSFCEGDNCIIRFVGKPQFELDCIYGSSPRTFNTSSLTLTPIDPINQPNTYTTTIPTNTTGTFHFELLKITDDYGCISEKPQP